jgi:hypothetical protein
MKTFLKVLLGVIGAYILLKVAAHQMMGGMSGREIYEQFTPEQRQQLEMQARQHLDNARGAGGEMQP